MNAQELLPLVRAAREFPGKPKHKNTLRRWAREGIQVPGVGTVKLRIVKIGREDYVPRDAITEFLAAQNPHYQGGIEVADSAEHAEAEARLAELGV